MKSLTVLKGVSLNLAQGLEVAGAAVVDVAGAIVANTKTAIKDTAQFVVENGASITFNGGVDVAAGGVFTVRTNATVNINGNSVLNGTVNLAENAYFNIKSGIVTAANTIQSEANTTINGALVFAAAAATYAQNKGTLLLDGAAAVINATTVTIANNAWLKGNGGSINGNLNIAAGGGIAIGNSPGTQYVNGNFALSSTSTFDLEIASASNYDKLVVRGTAAVDGILVGHLLNNYQPAAGERYTFITAVGKVSGGFNIVRGNDLANLGKFSTQVNEHTVDAYYANSAATAVASFFLMAIAFAFATL